MTCFLHLASFTDKDKAPNWLNMLADKQWGNICFHMRKKNLLNLLLIVWAILVCDLVWQKEIQRKKSKCPAKFLSFYKSLVLPVIHSNSPLYLTSFVLIWGYTVVKNNNPNGHRGRQVSSRHQVNVFRCYSLRSIPYNIYMFITKNSTHIKLI